MLGYEELDVSDVYVIPNPANPRRALAVTEGILTGIEELRPRASPGLKLVSDRVAWQL